MTLVLAVLGLLAALLLGIFLGLGRFQQSPREIERALEEDRPRKRVKRRFTLLDLMGSGKRRSREGERARFRTVVPNRREGRPGSATRDEGGSEGEESPREGASRDRGVG